MRMIPTCRSETSASYNPRNYRQEMPIPQLFIHVIMGQTIQVSKLRPCYRVLEDDLLKAAFTQEPLMVALTRRHTIM